MEMVLFRTGIKAIFHDIWLWLRILKIQKTGRGTETQLLEMERINTMRTSVCLLSKFYPVNPWIPSAKSNHKTRRVRSIGNVISYNLLLKVEVDFRAHQYIQYCLGLLYKNLYLQKSKCKVSPDFEPDLVLNISTFIPTFEV